jgi:purine-binding chemotaxis protein CheW
VKTSRRPFNAEIDWQELHARLAQTVATTREALRPSSERDAMLLEERARRLAQPLGSARSAGAALDLLVFTLTGERFGIEARHVQEVLRFTALTPVPGVPEFVAGVVNVRGQILVVFDIRPLCGIARKDVTDTSRIVVCGHTQPELGLVVDCVNDVVRRPTADLMSDAIPDDKGTDSFIRGVMPDATIVLDGSALLADQRLFVEQARP